MLIYPGTRIRTTEAYDKHESYGAVYLWEYPTGDIVADIYDFWLMWPNDKPLRKTLNPDEWELVEDAPDLHADMYERGLFDD